MFFNNGNKKKIEDFVDSNKFVNTYSDNYINNNKKLNFLPSVFVFCLIVTMGTVGFYSLRAMSQDANGVLFTNKIIKPEDKIRNEDKEIEAQEVELRLAVENLQSQNQQQKKSIKITNLADQVCQLDFAQSAPLEIELAANSKTQGWWLPENCPDKNLKAIQIIKLNPKEVDAIPSTNSYRVQALTKKGITAISYFASTEGTSYDLSNFSRSLAVPVFPDEGWFSEAKAYDTIRIENQTFYADNNCSNLAKSEPCNLWVADNYLGEVSLLIEDIQKKLNLIDTENRSIKFSKYQDEFPARLNLSISDKNNSDYFVVYTLSYPNLEIVQKFEVTKYLNGFWNDTYTQYMR